MVMMTPKSQLKMLCNVFVHNKYPRFSVVLTENVRKEVKRNLFQRLFDLNARPRFTTTKSEREIPLQISGIKDTKLETVITFHPIKLEYTSYPQHIKVVDDEDDILYKNIAQHCVYAGDVLKLSYTMTYSL